MSKKSQYVIIDNSKSSDSKVNIYTNAKAAFLHCKKHFSYSLSYDTFLRYFKKYNSLNLKDGKVNILVTAVTPKTAFVQEE